MPLLLADLDAFYLEHRRCGELDGGVEDGMVWMMCECGYLARPDDARPREVITEETVRARSA